MPVARPFTLWKVRCGTCMHFVVAIATVNCVLPDERRCGSCQGQCKVTPAVRGPHTMVWERGVGDRWRLRPAGLRLNRTQAMKKDCPPPRKKRRKKRRSKTFADKDIAKLKSYNESKGYPPSGAFVTGDEVGQELAVSPARVEPHNSGSARRLEDGDLRDDGGDSLRSERGAGERDDVSRRVEQGGSPART